MTPRYLPRYLLGANWLSTGNLLGLGACFGLVVAMVSGRLSPFAAPQSFGALGTSQAANIGAGIAVLALCLMIWRGEAQIKLRASTVAMVVLIAAFGVALSAVDLGAGRTVPLGQSMDLLRLVIMAVCLAVLAGHPPLFRMFCSVLVLTILVIAVSDYIYWRTQRGVIMGGVSMTRALILAMGISCAAFVRRPHLIWVLAIMLAAFLIFAGSMKIAAISVVVVFVVGLVGLFSTAQILPAAVFAASIVGALGISIATNDFANTYQRLYQLSLASDTGAGVAPGVGTNTSQSADAPAVAAPLAPEAPPIHPDCLASANPGYCSSSAFTVTDQTERLRLWGHGIAMIAQAPLFGHGAGAYALDMRYELNAISKVHRLYTYSYPHNLLIDLGVTHGLIGIMALLLVLLWALVAMLGAYKYTPAATGIVAAAFGILTSAMTGGDLYDGRYLLLLPFIAAGFAQAARR